MPGLRTPVAQTLLGLRSRSSTEFRIRTPDVYRPDGMWRRPVARAGGVGGKPRDRARQQRSHRIREMRMTRERRKNDVRVGGRAVADKYGVVSRQLLEQWFWTIDGWRLDFSPVFEERRVDFAAPGVDPGGNAQTQ